ncbi:cytochrome P450 [Xylaria sp. CBS 124048]|nr:cytochrome P450 [Xylaria sp. CBS 124048]
MAILAVELTTSLLAVGILSASLMWYVVTAIQSWYRLRRFPGPFLASFSYLWGYLAMRAGRMHIRVAEEEKKYGKIVRIGPNELLIHDPKTVRHMNGVRSNYQKGGWYSGLKLDPYGDSMLSERNTAAHDARKAKMAAGYAGKGGLDLEAKVNSELSVLTNLLKSKYLVKGAYRPLDLSRLILFFQTDVITNVGFGEQWGDLATETDVFGWISIADALVPLVECLIMVPFLRSLFMSSFFLKLVVPKPTDKKGMGMVLGLIKGLVARRFENSAEGGNSQECILDGWIKQGATRRECELELALVLPAGLETTATVMRGVMLHLLSAPTAYRKLQDEITRGVREGRISSPITNSEAKQLPYLQAVIYEGMRMSPPPVMGFPKRVPPGGDTISGHFVPEGTDVFLNVVSMLRNPEVFGEDANVFRPERFIECSAEERSELTKNVDLVFGHGRWSCPGETLARMELNKIFVEILRTCDLQIVNAQSPWKIKGYTTFKIDDFWVTLSERAEKI